MQATKVLIVDDHALFRQGVCNTLGRETTMEVVGEAEDEADALAKTVTHLARPLTARPVLPVLGSTG